MTVPDPVRHHTEMTPSAPALMTGAETWTWADLDARVGRAAAALEGDDAPLAVRAETSPPLVVLVLAALRAGRLLVPLSTRWTAGQTADALAVLGAPRALDDANLARLGAEAEGAERREAPPIPLDRPFTVVHTSGSTGRPKAILHTVGNHVWSARGVVEHLGLWAGDRWLLDLPLYHVGGLGVVVRCALAGASLAVPPRGMDPVDRIDALRPTHASLVATQLRRLLDAQVDLSGLKAVLLGGSAIPADLLDEAIEKNVPVVVSYGLTEMTSTVTATALPPDRAALATAGRALPHRRLRISEAGEIEVSGPARYAGLVTPDGIVPAPEWHPTGDLGHVDAESRLVVTGRRDLQFVSGGENVHPEMIEAALLALDGVAEAVVVPVSDATFGVRPVAFVRLDGRADRAAEVDGAALADALRERIPGFMVPVAFYAWPGAAAMKPDRPALAHEAERRAASGRGIGDAG